MDAQVRSPSAQLRRPPGEVMNTCRNSLLKQISTSHNVSPGEVVQFFGRRSLAIDLAVLLPFFLLYALLAMLPAGWLLRRYPPEESMTAALTMSLLCSLAFGVGGLLLGEQWSITAESIRVGTGHLSYRVDRLPWVRHHSDSSPFAWWYSGAPRLSGFVCVNTSRACNPTRRRVIRKTIIPS